MKKTIFLIAFALSFFTASAQVPVIITAGQSNTDGRVTEELPSYIKENGYKLCRWCYGSYDRIQTDGFEPFWPRTAHVKHPNSWAYDAVFYYLLEQQLKRQFYVIKFTLGGTAIDPGNPSSTNGLYWSADPEWLSQTSSTLTGGRSLLLSFIEEIDSSIDSQLSKLPEGFEIKAFLWHQGESDRQMAANYHDNLKNVVEYVRRHLVEKTGNPAYAALPFICGTVARSNRDYSPAIESALWQLSKELPNFHVIDMSAAELQRDRLHFTTKSAEHLGREMFKVFCRETNLNKFTANGTPWYDQRDSVVNAHGVGIIEDGGRFYMFGEAKTDSANVFSGFSCYSSDNLMDWRFERIALPVQKEGRLGPQRIGERPKVLRCPATGEFIMIAHSDDRRYKDPCVVFATSPTVDGEYTFRGPLLYKGEPIKRWDLGSFVDDDDRAYLLVHHGEIYRFSEDFHSLDSCMASGVKDIGESPAMLKKDGVYYWLSSNTTSWERNDNKFSTAPSLAGPWTYRGLFAPENSLTFNTQCSFVLPIQRDGETRHIYVGDCWSFPCQRSAATLVFLPIEAEEGRLRIPQYFETWNPLTGEAVELNGRTQPIHWQSDKPGSSTATDGIGIKTKLTKPGRIALKGRTADNGGYALVRILDRQGRELYRQLLDFYSKVPSDGLRYVSQQLPRGRYEIIVEVTGQRSNWSDKRRSNYGTRGSFVIIDEILFVP